MACGRDQLCDGVRSYIEDAIYAMANLFLQHGANSGLLPLDITEVMREYTRVVDFSNLK